MLVERASGSLLPVYGVDGAVTSYSIPPPPCISDFYENVDETGQSGLNQYFYNPISVWFPRPKNEVAQKFKILWAKDYPVGHSNISDHIFLPYARRLEYATVSTGSFAPLNNRVYLMMFHDFGLTTKQAPTASSADKALNVMYQSRFVYNDQ